MIPTTGTTPPEVHHLLSALHQFGLHLPASSPSAASLAEDLTAVLNRPDQLREVLQELAPQATELVVTGTCDRRLVGMTTGPEDPWWLIDLSGRPHRTRPWPAWTRDRLHLDAPWASASWGRLNRDGVRRLTRPRVLLVGLYKPEIFPLPRFSLSISDLARAGRASLTGDIRLLDMQLGATVADVLNAVDDHHWRPDIVGLSATFGQHDLLDALLTALYSRPDPPLVLAGGSLTVRNESLLLEKFPRLLVARGAGETTTADVLAHWHGDLDLDQVRGIGFAGAARGIGTLSIRQRRTATVGNALLQDALPELDLLDATLGAGGVAQLETSRGCTNACSFCPRGHKGTWNGHLPEHLPWLLARMSDVFTAHPEVARVLYLVDEEFIGAGPEAVPRALALASLLHEAGFSWETSCRIDQVRRLDRDRDWHLTRARIWRELVAHGLRRCLFGVESGVTSVLERFVKETTGEQNALAVRTLSALGVATRHTYITFDPLVTLEELTATHAFQARTDLLLRPLPHLDVEDIIDGVTNEDFVARHAAGRPFYTEIPYMLVSMECLTGAAYTRRVQQAGLARAPQPLMGRLDAAYADWRIGVAAHHAQLWIDRNFTLDYTLKSLEKTLTGPQRHSVRAARSVIKDSAFTVLTDMLEAITTHDLRCRREHALTRDLLTVLDARHAALRPQAEETVTALLPVLPTAAARRLGREHDRWQCATGWHLINASACQLANPA